MSDWEDLRITSESRSPPPAARILPMMDARTLIIGLIVAVIWPFFLTPWRFDVDKKAIEAGLANPVEGCYYFAWMGSSLSKNCPRDGRLLILGPGMKVTFSNGKVTKIGEFYVNQILGRRIAFEVLIPLELLLIAICAAYARHRKLKTQTEYNRESPLGLNED